VDKTGTLTEGHPVLNEVVSAGKLEEPELLALAAALERRSEHPLATAIVQAAGETANIEGVESFASVTGLGLRGSVFGKTVVIGSQSFMHAENVDTSELENDAGRLNEAGDSTVWVAIEGELAGLLSLRDPVKKTSHEALASLRKEGLRVVMVSGDNERTARAVASKLGISEVHAGMLPGEKLEKVQEYQDAGHGVAMAGDGINDAPALAAADVGIAMGTGTDIAMESAAITLVKGDLKGIARARKLSHLTMNNIRQNLFFAFVYNGLGVPIAAGILYPFIGLLLSPMIAAAAMSFSSVSVISNALRLRNIKL
jgi:Cu+-exporting ATPase